ncbi:hypothetical protein D3C71_2086370 [compost metagenome]
MVCVVAPLLQRYVAPVFPAFKVNVLPAHIVVSLPKLTDGTGFVIMLIVSVVTHPAALVTATE